MKSKANAKTERGVMSCTWQHSTLPKSENNNRGRYRGNCKP